MKKLLQLVLFTGLLFTVFNASAQQDKSKRPSPPDTVRGTIKGTQIVVAYSQPSVKGRTIGNEIAPYGKVWRTGANEATTIEFSKNVTVEGKALAAGKYALFSIPGEKDWVIIFNKDIKNWGTKYVEGDDVLRITVPHGKAPSFTEKLTFAVNPKGSVSFMWGNEMVTFKVK